MDNGTSLQIIFKSLEDNITFLNNKFWNKRNRIVDIYDNKSRIYYNEYTIGIM